MTTKKNFSVPIKEGETDLVSKDDLKTMVACQVKSGSTPSGEITMDSTLINGNLIIGEFNWTISGTVSWTLSYYFDPKDNTGSSVVFNVNWANVMFNVNPQTIITPLENNRRKVVSYSGISSPYFNMSLGSLISAVATNLHFYVTEIIYNEDNEIESSRTLLNSINVRIEITVEFEYDYVLQAPRIKDNGLSIIASVL